MFSLSRIISLLLLTAGGLLVGGSLVWFLAYGVEKGPPKRLRIEALEAPVRIGWGVYGEVAIEAEQERDAMVALGYAHGRERAWSVVLWRQAALGRLGEWFGEPALALDQLTRRHGLAVQARAAYAHLDEDHQAILHAYAAGLDAALRSPDIRLQQEFVLLHPNDEPWQPWHTLAIERLFAWLAASPPSPDKQIAMAPEVASFYEADHTLRQWLHLHGFENSMAWAARDTAGTHFFQRHVYGASALPFLVEVSIQLREEQLFWGASLPGTPFFPAGKSEQYSWALLLTGSAHLERIPWRPDSASLEYQRIFSKDGAEHLISFWSMTDRLPLLPSDASTPPDSVWALRWAGLAPTTDWPAWHGLLTGQPTSFQLLDGSGLWMERTGTWRTLGTPRVEVALPSGIFIGASRWSAYAAEFLRTQAGPVNLEAWIDDAYSIWAAQTAPPLVNAISEQPADHPALRDALTYLRNWDFAYDRASIAASIFDRWMSIYLDTTGVLPDSATSDSIGVGAPMLNQTLAQAVEALTEGFGADQSRWRWEHVQADRHYFPIWSVDALGVVGLGLAAQTRFADVEWPGHGHPTALAWGPSSIQHTLAAPAAWEAWHRTDAWATFSIRRRHLDPHAPLGRYLVSDRPPDPIHLTQPVSVATTTLLPSRQ